MRRKDSVRRGVRRLLASIAAFALAATAIAPALAENAPSANDMVLHAQAGEFSVIRLAGADRFETMGKVVEQGFGESDWAVVASGDDYVDALMAAGLAGSKHAPVVLTQKGSLTESAAHQLQRMKASHAYIVGGTDAVSQSVEEDLEAIGVTVNRVSGTDRYSTGVVAMHEIRDAGSKTDAVIIANGHDFADALSIGSWAHVSASPIVLTQADGTLPKETIKAIKEDKGLHRVIIVGGQNAVSDDVPARLGSGYEYTRLGGANRYETSAGVAEWTTTHGLSWENVALVTGNHFADALAGAATMGDPPMGDYHGPILLVSNEGDPTVKLLQSHAAEVAICFIFGGPASVSEALADPALYTGVPQQPAVQTVSTTQAQVVSPAPAPVDNGAASVVDTTSSSTVPVSYGSTGSGGTTSGTNSADTSDTEIPPGYRGRNSTGSLIPDTNVIWDYVLIKTTGKLHLPECGHIDRANKENRETIEDTTYDSLIGTTMHGKTVSACEHCLVPDETK